MKRIKSYLYIFIMFLLFPTITNAATELTAATQNPVVGTNVYVQLEANYGDKFKIGEFHSCIVYDEDYFDLSNVIWIKLGRDKGTYTTSEGRICIDKTGAEWTSGPIVQLELVATKEGFTEFKLERNGESYYTNGDVIAQTLAGIYINAVAPSENTLIKSLYVEGYTFTPTFSQTTYNYKLTVPADVTSVNVVGERYDNKQTITGTGKRDLEYGDNRVRVVVKAQNQSTRTYEIMITREDNRTGDVSLKRLNVSNTSIKLEKGKTVYEATVSKSIDTVLINGSTTDPNATVIGTGSKTLQSGLNVFELIVQSSGGKEQIYTIKITRSTEELQTITNSSKLLSLKVNGLVLDLSNNQTNFLYGINKDIDKLDIQTVTESTTAKVEIIGNDVLKSGINLVTIKVTEPETEKTPEEITEYTILVYKNPDDASIVKDISNIKGKTNYIYSTTSTTKNIVPASTIATLKKNNTKLYYNTVNMTNGLLTQIILKNNLPDTEVDATITPVEGSHLTYNINIPADNEVTIYVEDYYTTGTSVRIYSYDEANNYTLITDGVSIKNGYVTFTTNGQKNYIITTADLMPQKSPLEKILDKYKMYIIVGIVAFIVMVTIISIVNKKREEKELNEPLY